jgi:hypothetical protein
LILEIFIFLGVLLLLLWLYLYFRYFREKGERRVFAELTDSSVDVDQGKRDIIFSIAPWGDDSSPGSLTSPWKTLQYAINILQPGDKLLIREGIYKEYVSLKNSGTIEIPIVVSVFQGEEAVLDGDGVGWKYGFNFEFGVSFVILTGL